MPLPEYLEKVFASLDELEDGKLRREVGVGFGEVVASTWRGSMGEILAGMGVSA